MWDKNHIISSIFNELFQSLFKSGYGTDTVKCNCLIPRRPQQRPSLYTVIARFLCCGWCYRLFLFTSNHLSIQHNSWLILFLLFFRVFNLFTPTLWLHLSSTWNSKLGSFSCRILYCLACSSGVQKIFHLYANHIQIYVSCCHLLAISS